jgi:hypothetical protein
MTIAHDVSDGQLQRLQQRLQQLHHHELESLLNGPQALTFEQFFHQEELHILQEQPKCLLDCISFHLVLFLVEWVD